LNKIDPSLHFIGLYCFSYKIDIQGGETSRVRNVLGAKRPGGELTKGRNVQLPSKNTRRVHLYNAQLWAYIICCYMSLVTLVNKKFSTSAYRYLNSHPRLVLALYVVHDTSAFVGFDAVKDCRQWLTLSLVSALRVCIKSQHFTKSDNRAPCHRS